MIPEKRFSTTAIVAQYLAADDMPRRKLRDYEQGGIAIGDPTQGLQVQTWECYMLGDEVRVRPDPNGTPFICFNAPGTTKLSLAFDQNMRPVITFVVGGLTKLWWYDPVIAEMTFTSYPGTKDPVVLLDDKRDGQRDFSDVLFFYMKTGDASPALYMRAQRDRYGVEYAIGDFPAGTTTLINAGMTKNGRLKFLVLGKWPRTFDPRRPIPEYPPGIHQEGWMSGLNLIFSGDEYVAPTSFAPLEWQFELYEPPVSDPL